MNYVYFDNAATSWPKPPEVWQAMEYFMHEVGASPGRAGHKRTVQANQIVDETRVLLAELFNIPDPELISFTLNATDALNIALKGLLKPGDHVVTSSMEHNSVSRPLYVLEQQGVQVTKVQCDSHGHLCVKQVAASLKPNTKLLAVTHASNVTGTIMPINELGELARQRQIYFLVDASQTAGLEQVDVQQHGIHLLALPGHKGLYGPQGTGVLYVAKGVPVEPLRQGGTGSKSETLWQPSVLPEKFESGTLNAIGIAGLGAGLKFIRRVGLENIRQRENQLAERFIQGAVRIPHLIMHGPLEMGKMVPVISFEFNGVQSGKVGDVLDKKYNIACRAGLHCAPDAHNTLGTFERKLIRFSFSYFNQPEEIDYALKGLKDIAANLSNLTDN